MILIDMILFFSSLAGIVGIALYSVWVVYAPITTRVATSAIPTLTQVINTDRRYTRSGTYTPWYVQEELLL